MNRERISRMSMKQETLVLAVFFVVALAGIAMLTYPAMSGMMIGGPAVGQFLPPPIHNVQSSAGITMIPKKCTEKYEKHPLCAHCFDVSVANNDEMCVDPLVYKRTGIRSFYIDETGIILGNDTPGPAASGLPEI